MILFGGAITVTADDQGIRVSAAKGARGVVEVEIIGGQEEAQRKTVDVSKDAASRTSQTTEKLATRSVPVDECEVRMRWRST